MIEGAGLEVPDLVGVVEEAVAHQLGLRRRQPDQVHLLGRREFEIQIKSHAISADKKITNRMKAVQFPQQRRRKRRTSFSSLRLRVPARKVVEPASARTSAMHRACNDDGGGRGSREAALESSRRHRRCCLPGT